LRLCQNAGGRNWFRRIVRHERRMVAALTTLPLEHGNKADSRESSRNKGIDLGDFILVFGFSPPSLP
jgi:hypothetical protein